MRLFPLLTLVLVALTAQAADRPQQQPNIILVMTDDQGYGDLACHGNPIIKTPHLDAFYKEAVRFTDYHVSPTCSPTRSSLMTGRHEFKNGVTHTINERERMTLKAFTVAQLLKSAGYADRHLRQVAPGGRSRVSAKPARASTRSLSTAPAASGRRTSAVAATRRTTSISTPRSCTTASSRRPRAIAPTCSSARQRNGSTSSARPVSRSSLTSRPTARTARSIARRTTSSPTSAKCHRTSPSSTA